VKDPAFAAHRAAASALFTLFSLLAIALGLAEPAPLAAAASASLAGLWIATRSGVRGALASFASPLAMLLDQVLLMTAIAATGGARSPYALLIPAGVALAWTLEGEAAARFHAALSVLAVGGLAIFGAVSPLDPASRFPLAAMALGAPALLAAMEAASRARRESGVAGESRPVSAPAEPSAPTAAMPRPGGLRQAEAEILHDLRSPLSVIRVYADLIAEGARRGQLPNGEHLANLKREIELAESLVEGAGRTTPARESSGAAEPAEPVPSTGAPPPQDAAPASADLVEILGSLATAYRLSRAGNRRIEFIAERPQLPVGAEPVALQRAFRNVIENAIKYTADGGEIRIRAGAAGPHAFVVVKDTGIGMSAEERSRAFDYAFRGSGAVASGKPGKGLGLALTKQILEANGGRISLSSEAGFGSEVTILLPFQRGSRG